jgi:DNA anti-recombination protein RmuC
MGGNFASVQQALDGAVRKWNTLVSQVETRVLARARRFPELGVQVGGEIAEVAPVEQQPQLPGRGEWSGAVGEG